MTKTNENVIPKFLLAEIELVIKNLKTGKATGHDDITNEQIKYGEKILTQKLTCLTKYS